MIAKRYLTGGISGVTHGYANTTALVGHTTAFDRAGNKLYERHLESEDRSHLYQPFNSDGSFAVGYDSANRLQQYQRGVLSSATIPYLVNPGASIQTPTTLPGADQVRTYGLDGLGNWKTSNFTEVGSGGSTTSTAEVRQHNYVNEITSVKDTVDGTPQTPTPFTYDKNGNLLNDGIRSYQYDALNRLVHVSDASTSAVVATYAYDGLNRRIQKTIADLGGGNGGLTGDIPAGTTNYLYDGQQMAMARDADGGWTQTYFWGRYIDELLFFAVPTETVPTTYRVLSDLLYRSVAIVTTSNAVTEAYDCDAYGNTLCYSGRGIDGLWFTDDDVRINNPINTTIFTGRQYDPESQIYYYRARYFSPQIGRFITRDPIGVQGGINLYAYVNNKAPNAVDYTGLTDCCNMQDAACIDAGNTLIATAKQIIHFRKAIAALNQQVAMVNTELAKLVATSIQEHAGVWGVLAVVGGLAATELLGWATLGSDILEVQNIQREINALMQDKLNLLQTLQNDELELSTLLSALHSQSATFDQVNVAFNTCVNTNNEDPSSYACPTEAFAVLQALGSVYNY